MDTDIFVNNERSVNCLILKIKKKTLIVREPGGPTVHPPPPPTPPRNLPLWPQNVP